MFVNVAALRAGQPGRGESGSSREGPRVTVGGRLCLWLSAVAFALLAKTPSPVGTAIPSGCVWRLARQCPRPRCCVSGRPCPCGTPAPPVCAPLPVHPGPHAPGAGPSALQPSAVLSTGSSEDRACSGLGESGPLRVALGFLLVHRRLARLHLPRHLLLTVQEAAEVVSPRGFHAVPWRC